MRILFSIGLVFSLTLFVGGCGGKETKDKKGKKAKSPNQNKSEAVKGLIKDTAKIYADYAKQIESTLGSGRKQNEIIADLKTISERYESRVKVEIGTELKGLETAEIRAYYMAIAGHEAERAEMVDPEIKEMVAKLRNLGAGTPLGDHAKGYVITFLNRCNSSASTAILESVKK